MIANSSPPELLVERSGGLLRLTLNRPQQRNALTATLIDWITAELSTCLTDTDIRVVVIAGAGTAFCAGHDLNELIVMSGPQRQALFGRCSEMMMTIQRVPQPVIAQVQGVATAAGCQLVASCDLAVAATSASFATPGVDIGLFCSTPAVALSRAVPTKQALKMLLTGERVTSSQALQMGLVSDLVDDDHLLTATADLAELIASKSAGCMGAGKQAFYRQQGLPLALAYEDAAEQMLRNLDSEVAREGIDAFLNKRPPHWPD